MSVVATISKSTVVKKEIVEGDVYEVVKGVASELLKRWEPSVSDFIILRDFYTVQYPIPVSKELIEKIKRFSPKRVENSVQVALPVFEIVYGAQWSGDSIQVEEATVVFPYIDEKTTEEVLRGVVEGFSAASEEED